MSFFVPTPEPCGCKIEREITACTTGLTRVRYTICSWCQVRGRLTLAWRSLEDALHVVEMQRECGWTLPEEVQP